MFMLNSYLIILVKNKRIINHRYDILQAILTIYKFLIMFILSKIKFTLNSYNNQV